MLTHEELLDALPHVIDRVDLVGWGPREQGKVRDIYRFGNRRILISTDRISAFDRVLDRIPHRGQVLNQLSAWWFARTGDIVGNHLLTVPDPNVTIAREAQPLPVEIVVRGYITGVTKTSLWYLYAQGERTPYGIPLPDGLQKNDPLPQPLITPTTKALKGGHDERLTRADIVGGGLVAAPLYARIEEVAVALYLRGRALAREAGLLLVDTKYEFGLVDGELVLIDEIHTPDSSRYWLAESVTPGGEPENYDKEFMRRWYAAQGYRGDGDPPTMPADFVARIAARYLETYERLTGIPFLPGAQPAGARIAANLTAWQAEQEEVGA